MSAAARIAPVLIAGAWTTDESAADTFQAFDPTTGEAFGERYPVSGTAEMERALLAATAAAPQLAATEPSRIADFLDAYAAAIEAMAGELVAVAHRETALPKSPRLADVELPRTTGQLRQAAKAVRESAWTQPVIDTAAGLRALLAPLGKPVLVFGPNNFPFAFNAIAGSDFASAIAARDPVIAKGHPNHPGTSRLLAEAAFSALAASGLPTASVQMLYALSPGDGLALAGDARLGAIGFTGSRAGGLALKAAADRAGVPFFAELSSINPVLALAGALRERGSEAFATEFIGSCTLGSGQFCTQPGLLLLPVGAEGDAVVAAMTTQLAGRAPMTVFSAGVRDGLAAGVQHWRKAGAQLLAGTAQPGDQGFAFTPGVFAVDAATFLANTETLQGEIFGPVSLVVRYDGAAQAAAIIAALEGNLTGTIYAAGDGSDDRNYAVLAPLLRTRVGRLIHGRMPTGVAVSPAMNHGGPYPSTSQPGFTAVGMPGAIRRFAALHSYDQVPDRLLPAELRDGNPLGIERQVDGAWTRAAIGG